MQGNQLTESNDTDDNDDDADADDLINRLLARRRERCRPGVKREPYDPYAYINELNPEYWPRDKKRVRLPVNEDVMFQLTGKRPLKPLRIIKRKKLGDSSPEDHMDSIGHEGKLKLKKRRGQAALEADESGDPSTPPSLVTSDTRHTPTPESKVVSTI